jgi:hypothetical protein
MAELGQSAANSPKQIRSFEMKGAQFYLHRDNLSNFPVLRFGHLISQRSDPARLADQAGELSDFGISPQER